MAEVPEPEVGELGVSAQALCLPVPCSPDGPFGECDDGIPDTWDICTNGFCDHKSMGGGCINGIACDDGSACTIDECKEACPGDGHFSCVHTPIASCCTDNPECDDGKYCTIDKCNIATLSCIHTPKEGCCEGNTACDDDKPCTDDWCVNYDCFHVPFKEKVGCPPPPPPPLNCDDGKVCTLDSWDGLKCQHQGAANCCEGDFDAVTACDDGSPCTIDYCLNNVCRHTEPKKGCCATVLDCNDNDEGTVDSCQGDPEKIGKGQCKHVLTSNCECSQQSALLGSECSDGNKCTADACMGCFCVNTPIPGCCLDKFDCDDGAACTFDMCIFNGCYHWLLQSDKDCCTPETASLDCYNHSGGSLDGKCLQQPDASYKCVNGP